MSIPTALVALAEALTLAGCRATVDPRDLNLPGAIVEPDEFDPDTFCGDGSGILTVTVTIMAPDSGRISAHETLSPLMNAAMSVIDLAAAITFGHIETPNGSDIPAYVLKTKLAIEGT